MPAAPSTTPGALLLGDSFNMRHPLTGGGMTTVCDLCLKPVASTINTLAGALFKGASAIMFPIIKAGGVGEMFFPASLQRYYRAASINC
ncbi:hypothetical protein WN943_014390 [Citrus x changshan-huyou]